MVQKYLNMIKIYYGYIACMISSQQSYYRSVTLTWFVSVFLSFSELSAQELERDKLVFGLFETPPYVVVKNQRAEGMFVDILEILKRETDLIGVARVAPIKRLVKEHNRRGIQCTILADLPSVLSRFPNFFPTDLKIDSGVLAGRYVQLDQYSDLYGLDIAVVRGTHLIGPFNTDHKLNKMMVNNYLSAVKLLDLGKVQAVAGAMNSFDHIIKTNFNNKKISGDRLLFGSARLGVACIQPENPNILKKIQQLGKIVKDLTQKGRFTNLGYEYFLF